MGARGLSGIFDSYHRADGSLEVPPVLREYISGLERIEPQDRAKGTK